MGSLFEEIARNGQFGVGEEEEKVLKKKRPKPKPDKGKEERLLGKGEYLAQRMPKLPKSAYISPEKGKDACQWLDDYIALSRKWSSRAYDGFHESCALWLLSTIAARRIGIHLGKLRYTNLYIALVARTSLFAKSTTAEIAIETLETIELLHLLVPDNITPERFISVMANGSVKTEESNKGVSIQFMSGQRGWFYEEFGQHVAAMMKSGGTMSAFLSMLKRLDDGKDKYTYSTIARKDEIIINPYLALLANMTPDCLKPYAKKGSSLWGDGFLARFALVCPPEETKRARAPFPRGKRKILPSLSTPLKEWDQQLQEGNKTLKMTKLVRKAYEAYDNALLDIMVDSYNTDLDGNYVRLPEKALRIAVLLASLSGSNVVQPKHWAKAQDITERWREGLHELYSQINDPTSERQKLEERLLYQVKKNKGFTMNTARQYFPNVSASDVLTVLDPLVENGILEETTNRKGYVNFRFPNQKKENE